MDDRANSFVVGIGLVNKDHVLSVPSWERDQKSGATASVEQVGGPVPVALAAIARLGTNDRLCFLGVIGDDRDGDDIARWLHDDGVDTSMMTRAPGTLTSKSLVILDERDHSRTVANHAPPQLCLTRTLAHEALFARARLLHLDGRYPEAALPAAQAVRQNGGMVSLDLGTMRPGGERLLPWCDIVLASHKGARGAFADASSPEEQVQRFLDQGARVAGVTLGANGVVVGEQGQKPIWLAAFAVSPVVDTCGAGDTFHGAFLWAHLHGKNLVAAADFAQAAVALRITRLGNRAGLPTRKAVEAFLARSPERNNI